MQERSRCTRKRLNPVLLSLLLLQRTCSVDAINLTIKGQQTGWCMRLQKSQWSIYKVQTLLLLLLLLLSSSSLLSFSSFSLFLDVSK